MSGRHRPTGLVTAALNYSDSQKLPVRGDRLLITSHVKAFGYQSVTDAFNLKPFDFFYFFFNMCAKHCLSLESATFFKHQLLSANNEFTRRRLCQSLPDESPLSLR